MPRKKAQPSEPKAGSAAEMYSHFTAVLENIEQQNRATIEAVFAAERRLTERFDTRFEKLELRVGALELAVRQNSEDIRQLREAVRKNSEDIRKNSEDIRKNSEDIASLQLDVKRIGGILGADRDVNVIAMLESRVAQLEARVGIAPPTGH